MNSSSRNAVVVALARPGVATTLLAVAIAGSLVARQGRPIFWWVTILVVTILIVAATRSSSAAAAGMLLANLPASLRQLVATTLSALPAGDASNLLRGIARLADAALATRDRTFDHQADDNLEEQVVDLVEACCEAGRGLGRIEVAWPGGVEAAPQSLSESIESARAAYVHQLQEASATLARLTASVAQRDARASQRISELSSDIRQEIAAREQAMAELDRLLSR